VELSASVEVRAREAHDSKWAAIGERVAWMAVQDSRSYAKASRITNSMTMVSTAETSSEPAQPSRLEKKKNTYYPFPAKP